MTIKKVKNFVFGKKESTVPSLTILDALEALDTMLLGKDYGFSGAKPFKKVTLLNPKECESKVDYWELIKKWGGLGHHEWESIIVSCFMTIVERAIKQGKEEADISRLFERDLLDSDGEVCTQQQIYDCLISRSFEVIEESDEEIKIKMKMG